MIQSKTQRRIWLATSALAVSLVGVAMMSACRDNASAPQPLTPVRAAEVQSIDSGTTNTYSANIQPYQQVDLAFKSNGYLVSVRQVKDAIGHVRYIDQGDWVTKGTVLATVDQDDFKEKLQQANAQLARGQANYERAKLSFDRVSVLYQGGAATKPDYDNANAQMLDGLASIQGAKASVAEAQIALGYCELRAPFDGWLVKRNVDVGQLVGPATNGFTIADVRSVKAVFGVPDTAMEHIQLGSSQTITADAVAGSFAGHVTSISPSADPKSRVYSVEVTVPNGDNRLKAGMIASITIGGRLPSARVNVVPLTAVIRSPSNPNGFAVYVTDGPGDTVKVHTKDVTLGDTYGNNIAVMSGLDVKERVVTSGTNLIKDGDQVRVIP